MAGTRITQLRYGFPGRREGSFVGKPAASPAMHPVGKLTQLWFYGGPGERYSSFAGRPAAAIIVARHVHNVFAQRTHTRGGRRRSR